MKLNFCKFRKVLWSFVEQMMANILFERSLASKLSNTPKIIFISHLQPLQISTKAKFHAFFWKFSHFKLKPVPTQDKFLDFFTKWIFKLKRGIAIFSVSELIWRVSFFALNLAHFSWESRFWIKLSCGKCLYSIRTLFGE